MSFLKSLFTQPEQTTRVVDLNVKDVLTCLEETLEMDCFQQSEADGFYLECMPSFLQISRKELQAQLALRVNTIRLTIKHHPLSNFSDLESMITEEVITETGMFKSLIQLWVCYCRCQICMMGTHESPNSTQQIQKFIHKQLNLFSLYLWYITQTVFKQGFWRYVSLSKTKIAINQQYALIEAIKSSLTDTQYFQQLYEDIAPKLVGRRHRFSAQDFHETEKELERQFDIHSETFFQRSMQLLKEFYNTSSISAKAKKLLQLRQSISEQISLQVDRGHIAEAESEDSLSNIYVYLIKNCKKNIIGACFYMELILCPFEIDILDDQAVCQTLRGKIVEMCDPVLEKIFRAIKSYGSLSFDITILNED